MQVDRLAFTDAMRAINEIAVTKETLAILANAVFIPENGMLKLVANNLDTSICISIPAENAYGPGISFPARLVLNIIKSLPKNMNTVEIDTLAQTVAGVKLTGLPTNDFPPVMPPAKRMVNVPGLLIALNRISAAIGSDEYRRAMNGVCLNTNEVAATDGHRLHVGKIKWKKPASLKEKDLILSAKGVRALLSKAVSRFATSYMALEEKRAVIKLVNGFIAISLIDDTRFPSYKHVMRNESSITAIADSKTFIEAVKAVKSASSDHRKTIDLIFRGQSMYLFIADENAKCRFEVPIKATYADQIFDWNTIGINANYLLDALESINQDKVTFGVKDPLTPLIFNADRLKIVIMPFRTTQHTEEFNETPVSATA